MALYMSAGRRRRRLVIITAVASVLGLGLGWALGRATAPTVTDRVSSVRAEARSLDGRLQALPSEYGKVLAGDPQYANGGGPADSLLVIRNDAIGLADDAEWLTNAQRSTVADAVQHAMQIATDRGSVDELTTAIDGAIAVVNQTFGVS